MTDALVVQGLRARAAEALTEEARARARDGRPALTREEERELARMVTARIQTDQARAALARGRSPRNPSEDAAIARAVDAALFEMGKLQPYFDLGGLDNVIVHGATSAVLEWADGTVEMAASPFETPEECEGEVRALAARRGRTERRFDTANPRLDLRLEDGSRLSAVMSVSHVPTVVIRRHRFMDVSLEDQVGLGTIDQGMHGLLVGAVRARLNLLVAGGTNVGKTTFLRSLLRATDPDEHLVTVETSFELSLHNFPERHRNVTALEAREANAEGEGERSVDELVQWSLRLNPDRIVVGEVLGDEARGMLNALSQGNDGSMASLHARRSDAVARRLASYVSQSHRPLPVADTMDLIADALDLVVFLSRVRDDRGRWCRVVSSVREVLDTADGHLATNELYRPGPDGRAMPTGVRPRCADELAWAGFDLSLLERPRMALA